MSSGEEVVELFFIDKKGKPLFVSLCFEGEGVGDFWVCRKIDGVEGKGVIISGSIKREVELAVFFM